MFDFSKNTMINKRKSVVGKIKDKTAAVAIKAFFELKRQRCIRFW